jgi:hypothetical protein
MVKYSSRWPRRTRLCRVALAIAIQPSSRHGEAVVHRAHRKGAVGFPCGVVGVLEDDLEHYDHAVAASAGIGSRRGRSERSEPTNRDAVKAVAVAGVPWLHRAGADGTERRGGDGDCGGGDDGDCGEPGRVESNAGQKDFLTSVFSVCDSQEKCITPDRPVSRD